MILVLHCGILRGARVCVARNNLLGELELANDVQAGVCPGFDLIDVGGDLALILGTARLPQSLFSRIPAPTGVEFCHDQ